MYDTWLFDWDGCLADTKQAWIKSCQLGLEKHGISLSWQEVCRDFEMGLIPHKYLDIDKIACTQDILAFAQQQLTFAPLFPETLGVLSRLHKSARQIGLVTNSFRTVLHTSQAFHQAKPWLNVTISQEDVTFPKPHPDGIFKALATFAHNPQRSVFIGDATTDIQAAHKAGIDSILIQRPTPLGEVSKLTYIKPTYTICNITTLFQFID